MNRQALENSMTDIDQRNYIKIGVSQGKSASAIKKELNRVLGRRAYKLRTIKDWVKKFNEGRSVSGKCRGGPHRIDHHKKEKN